MDGAADQVFEEFIPQVYRCAEDTPENVVVATGEQTLERTNVLDISSINSEEYHLVFPYYRDGNEILVNNNKQFNSEMFALQAPDSTKIADSELIFIQRGTSNSIPEETKSLNVTSCSLSSLAICEEGRDSNENDGCQEDDESHTKCLGSSLPEDIVIRSTISTRTYSISPKSTVGNSDSHNVLHLSDNCDNHDIEETDYHTGIESEKECACATLKPRAFNLYIGVTEKNIFALHNIDITLPINCDLCHIRFYDMKSFDNHMKSHIDKKHFMCQLCPKTYVTWENLVAHRKVFHQGQFISCKDCSCRKHHQDLGPLRFPVGEFPSGCEECKEGFINSAQLNKHYRSHIPERYENERAGKGKKRKLIQGCYPIDVCAMREESFQESVESTKKSLTVGSNRSSKELQAQETQQNLRSSSEDCFKCPFCNGVFSDLHSYKNHKMTHAKQNKCKSSRANLMKHYLNCINEKRAKNTQKLESKLICHICGEVCFNSNFQEHMTIHSSEDLTFVCEICGIMLCDNDSLIAHSLSHSPFGRNVSDSKSSVSPKSTLKKRDSVSNIVPNCVCEYCGREFKRNTYLQLHVRRHTGEKPYQCNQCNKTFYTGHQLSVHVRHHSGERPYVCSVCRKSFATSTDLYAHKKLHSNNIQHTCSMCGKKFLWRSAYHNHMRIHSNIRPHKCEICCKAFSFKSRLTAHMNRHKESKISNLNLNKQSNGMVSYQCSDCGKSFASPDELENHHEEKCYLTMITFVSSGNDTDRTENSLLFLDSCKEQC